MSSGKSLCLAMIYGKAKLSSLLCKCLIRRYLQALWPRRGIIQTDTSLCVTLGCSSHCLGRHWSSLGDPYRSLDPKTPGQVLLLLLFLRKLAAIFIIRYLAFDLIMPFNTTIRAKRQLNSKMNFSDFSTHPPFRRTMVCSLLPVVSIVLPLCLVSPPRLEAFGLEVRM